MKDDFILPTIEELAQSAKEPTIQTSIRIRERTQALFEMQAKIYDVSVSALINSLLDAYAENFYRANFVQNEELRLDILKKYMVRSGKNLQHWDDATIIHKIAESEIAGQYALYDYGPEGINLNDVHAMMLAIDKAKRGDARETPQLFINDGAIQCLRAGAQSCVRYVNGDIDICVDGNKWTIVSYLALAYEKKMRQLFPGRDGFIGQDYYQKIVDILNSSSDREATIDNIVRVYIDFLENYNEATNEPDKATTQVLNRHPRLKNVEILVMALSQLGGEAHLSEIYATYEKLWRQLMPDRQLSVAFTAIVRGTLERFSSDSSAYNGKNNYFSNPNKGEGTWRLNQGVRYVPGQGIVESGS